MRTQWQLLLEWIWPSRFDPDASLARRMAILQALIAIGIALAAGPEVIAAMEMTTVLELLGASLFLTTYAAAIRMTVSRVLGALGGVLLPMPQMVIVKSQAPMPVRAAALAYSAGFAVFCLMHVLVIGFFGKHLFSLAT